MNATDLIAAPAAFTESALISDEDLDRSHALALEAWRIATRNRRYPDDEISLTDEQQRAFDCWQQPDSDFLFAWKARAGGVPLRLRRASIAPGACHEIPAVAAARAFVEELRAPAGRRAFAACGPTGVGKSWAALGIARAVDISFHFYHVPRLVQRLLDPDQRDSVLAQAYGRRLLIILDDLGAGYLCEGGLAEGLIEQVLWEREAENLPTLITSNLTRKQLLELLGGRIADRLRGSWGSIVELPGTSLRTPRAPGR